jgi:hypothetical protein
LREEEEGGRKGQGARARDAREIERDSEREMKKKIGEKGEKKHSFVWDVK